MPISISNGKHVKHIQLTSFKLQYSSQKLENSVMNILTMLLPGNVLVEPSADGDVDVDSDLIAVRNSDSILHGTYNSELLGNKTVFAYQR